MLTKKIVGIIIQGNYRINQGIGNFISKSTFLGDVFYPYLMGGGGGYDCVNLLEKKIEIDNSKTATKPTINQPLNFDNFLCT